MVNENEFAKRLEYLLKHYELNASSFAEEIEVGRSSISHILSGRNKPSLDFILKILHSYPEINLYWLMNGKGSFLKKDEIRDEVGKNIPSSKIREEDNKPSNADQNSKEIERIIIFYKDGSFKVYSPDQAMQ